MTIRVQNLRSKTPGVKPSALLPGQLCFNLADHILYVGTGSDINRDINGQTEPTAEGTGWIAVSIALDFFLKNPEKVGVVPSNGDVLTYSASMERPTWTEIRVGDLSLLKTSDKTSIVGAINELYDMLNP